MYEVGSPLRVVMHGEFVEFGIVERQMQIKTKARSEWREYDYSYEYSGLLCLQITSAPHGVGRTRWRDGKKQRVESLLAKFVVGLEVVAEAQTRRRIDRERRHREYEERLRVEEEARIRRQVEQERVRDLDSRLAQFHRARLIRDFMETVHTRGEENQEQREWLAWASEQADRAEAGSMSGLGLHASG